LSAIRYVLARAAEQGFFEAVVPALAPFDPLLRGTIRRGARRAFAKASADSKVTDEAHLLRLAFLRLGPRPAPGPDDVEGVKAAFDAARTMFPKRGRAFWPVSFGAVVVVLLVVGIVAVVLWFPTRRERFAHSSLGEAMGDGLTDWTVGVGRRDFTREDKGRKAILARGVERQIGDGPFNLLGTALDETEALHEAASPEELKHAQSALETTLHDLDAALETKKQPGFIDAYVDVGFSTNVWLLGYYVEDRATLTVGTNTVPMLRGRRLDNLNIEVGGKAYESKVLGGWVIALDEVDEWTIANVVPALGKAHGFAFGQRAAEEEGSGGRLAMKAGERVRAELLARAGLSEEDGTELADLLSQRHSAFIRLAVLGDELFEPRGLTAKPKLKQALSRRKDLEMDAREITRIEDRLSRFEKPFDKVAAAQSAIDEIRVAADATCVATHCAIADDPELEKVGLGKASSLASHLMMVARAETTYTALAESELGSGGYATYFLIERELGLAPEWFSQYGVKDTAEHNQLGAAMFDKPVDAIRKAAETAYQKTFGAPMPAVTRTQAPH
jgi:hypothetical protein